MDYAKVSKCSANLEITGSFNTTGGLIGQMSNQNEGPNIVENSYAVGSIRGNRTNMLKNKNIMQEIKDEDMEIWKKIFIDFDK